MPSARRPDRPPGSRRESGDTASTRVPRGAWSRRTSLRDGTRTLLRQIRPEDRAELARGLQELSPASRYLRFHTQISTLNDAQLTYLTEVDHHDHEAIVMIDLDTDEPQGIGVARFIREVYEPDVAEAAITVADAYHGRGAGTILLGALAARACEEDVRTFRNYVLAGNHGMLEVFDQLGAERRRETDGLWRIDLDVPCDDGAIPDTPGGRAFLAMATEDRTFASLLPPVWSRWRLQRGRRDVAEDDDGHQGAASEVLAEELEDLRAELDVWLQRRETR